MRSEEEIAVNMGENEWINYFEEIQSAKCIT